MRFLAVAMFFWEPLRDYYFKHKTFEKIDQLPLESYSGLAKGYLKGIFFYYKYEECYHYWYLYDVKNKTIIKNKEKILEFIAAKEEDKTYIPNWQKIFYEVKGKIENEIEGQWAQESLVSQRGRRNEFKNPAEKFIIDGLRLLKQQIQINELIGSPEDKKRQEVEEKLYKFRKTKKTINQLRRIWRSVKNKEIDWREILNKWHKILETKFTFEIEEKVDFDKSKLKLVTYEFIS